MPEKPRRPLLTAAILIVIPYLFLLIVAWRHGALYRSHAGFIDITLSIANVFVLPLTLYFSLANYLTQRRRQQLDRETVTLCLQLRNAPAASHCIAIPRTLCTRQEIKGILSDSSTASYNIPYLATPEFLGAVAAVRNGERNELPIYLDHPDELDKFRPQPTHSGKTWFISRHPGAIDWIKQQPGWHIDHIVSHLNPEDIQPGDTVLGTLPVHLAAAICARGAAFYFLQIPQKADKRGSEYSATDMTRMGVSLKRFHIQAI
ncbi:MAG: CRISPR-associated protein Csx16 [Cardiobacteriaceae bacterium]|nr:CRISPR-associated protein Csx16 [Cardiobacteriaceae bacterium]